jgi:leucine dehydrogenase
MTSFEELLETWDGEQALVTHDKPSGAWIFICRHSTKLGPAAGGTRMKVYAMPAEGLDDAMRLAAGMTAKFAVAGVGLGGGKAVLAVRSIPEGRERRALLHRYGDIVESLNGSFLTSSDVNTGPEDMDTIGERTGYVFGRTPEHGGAGNPAPHTAKGIYHGIRASLAHVFGSDDLTGRTVLVQGAGSVGAALASLLREAGARVIAADVDESRAAAVGDEVVPAAAVYETECDVYSPCALGATLSEQAVSKLRCRIVAGSANNQLAEPEAAERLRAAGILYAPDYVINAGGAIALVGLEQLGWNGDKVARALARIGETLREIYERADDENITTAEAADRLATSRIG